MFLQNYRIEFILHSFSSNAKDIRNSLAEFVENMDIADSQEANEKGSNFKISLSSPEPTVIFDICSQFGRIKNVKVNEIEEGI
jgi:hypothetical protein